MNISFRLLFLTIPLSFCSPSSSMGMACELGSAEWITPDKKQTEPSPHLKLIIKEADALERVLTLDKLFYDNHIYDRERSEEFRRPLMAEFVAHAYLIPSVHISVALIKQLAQQEKTDPEMDNLKLAVAAIPPLTLKYLRATYGWENDKSDATPVHPKAGSKPISSQQVIVKISTRHYQASMNELLASYKEHRKEARVQDQKEVDKLKDKLAETQRGDARHIPENTHALPNLLSHDH